MDSPSACSSAASIDDNVEIDETRSLDGEYLDSEENCDDDVTDSLDGGLKVPVKLWPTHHRVSVTKYATSTDSRGYIPVYEYTFGQNTMMMDSENGMIHFTGIWRSIGHSKADVVRLIESQPEIAGVVRKVRGGYLKIQGTWLPYEIAHQLAKRVAWSVRDDLVPLFGPDFPDSCIAPGQPGFGQLLLSSPNAKGGRRQPKDPEARSAAQAAAKIAQNRSSVSTASQIDASRPMLSKIAETSTSSAVSPSPSRPPKMSQVGPARRSKSYSSGPTPTTRSVSNSSSFLSYSPSPARYSPYPSSGYCPSQLSKPTPAYPPPPPRYSRSLPYGTTTTSSYPPPPLNYQAPSAQVSSGQLGMVVPPRTAGGSVYAYTHVAYPSISANVVPPSYAQYVPQVAQYAPLAPSSRLQPQIQPAFSAPGVRLASYDRLSPYTAVSSASDMSSLDYETRSIAASSSTSNSAGNSEYGASGPYDTASYDSRRMSCWGYEGGDGTILSNGYGLRPSISLSSLPTYSESSIRSSVASPRYAVSPVEMDFTSPVEYAPSERREVIPKPFFHLEQASEPPENKENLERVVIKSEEP